jgi:hypothetical protein
MYGVHNLDTLPADLDPRKHATQMTDEVTIFFTGYSILSNHYMGAPIEIKGKHYKCNEQYYFASLAKAYGDDTAYKNIMKEVDPVEMLRLGKRAVNHNNIDWSKQQIAVLTEANAYKYKQNCNARDALRATGTTRLGEASPKADLWGIGLSLYHKDRADPNFWTGQNKMGDILTQIRADLPPVATEQEKPMD